MRFGRVAVWLTMLSGAIALASPAHAALADWKGHLEVGYAKLIQGAAPSGGISVATGVDYPLNSRLRLGPDFSYHLLGTRSVLNGSINGSLDYSMWEVGLRAQWNPRSLGPLRRVTFGPALMGVSAQVSSSSAGLAFENEEVSGLRGGLALDLAWLPAHDSPVRPGVEFGTRAAFAGHDTWTVVTARFLLSY